MKGRAIAAGLVASAVLFACGAALVAQDARAQAVHDGWTIPAGAEAEKNPFPTNPSVLAAGNKAYLSKCRRCHGQAGRGDGPDAERKYQADMDLTKADRASANPDGILFYKIWNGRSSPKMPRFSAEVSREQVWALVAYVQSLRSR